MKPEYLKKANDAEVALYNMLPRIDLLEGIQIDMLKTSEAIKCYDVSYPSEKYTFLHESAVIVFHDVLFAAWYNNEETELDGKTPIRFARSFDGGKTWTLPEIVTIDSMGSILFCPPIFGICKDKLYMMLNQMVAPDCMHTLDLYLYDEVSEKFGFLWSRPIPFKLNTNVYKLDNGKLLLPGRVGELDQLPKIPAVMISDSGEIDNEWRLIKIQENEKLPDGSEFVYPELSAIIDHSKIYAFCRNDNRKIPIMYMSEDYGEHWTGPYTHDLPFIDVKIYSGTLSNGSSYIIGNIHPGRKTLAIFFSEPGTMRFTKGYILQSGFCEALQYGARWHYPSAYEDKGSLYVIYTVGMENGQRGAAMSVIDLNSIFNK